jgi:hypothetical protein
MGGGAGAEACLEVLRRMLRCLGLLEGTGGVQSPAQKMVMLSTLLDLLEEKPELPDVKLQLEATEAASKLQMLLGFHKGLGNKGAGVGGMGGGS